MAAKQNAEAQPDVSPSLFKSEDDQPMSFYLCPGPLKQQLQPLITAGGGTICKVQQPAAILLIDPKDTSSIPNSTAHRYVSTQYIHDCVEKNKQLNLDDYRLDPKVPRQSARLSGKVASPGVLGGRAPYTPKEDAAILNYVSKRKSEVGGNRLWQEMAKEHVTAHSWQSMKYRYKVRLAKQQTGDEAAETTQDDEKETEETTEDSDVAKTQEEAAPPQELPAETEPTQADEQSVPAGIKSEDEEAKEETLQADDPPAETSDSAPTEESGVDLQTEGQATAPETAQPAGDEPQSQSEEEESPSPQRMTQLKSPKRKFQDEQETPERRVTRRQLQFKASTSSKPSNKKLQSSPLRASKRGKSAPNDGSPEDLPPKRTREKSEGAEAESQSEESGESHVSETPQTDEPKQQEPLMKRPDEPMGILERAIAEFGYCSSDDDETPDFQVPAQTAATPVSPSSGSQHAPEPQPVLHPNLESDPESDHESEPEPESKSDPEPEKISPKPQPSSSTPASAQPPVGAGSNVHMFIFDSESQQDEPLPAVAGPSCAPPAGGAALLSLSQAQTESDSQLIRDLMAESEKDLETVIKSLLKTSGDTHEALKLLQDPSSSSNRLLWSRSDDSKLLSGDPDVRQELRQKYGEEEVAKRMVYLEVEK
ncbi:unnamed protein product [Ophioblennius macclurei]